MEAKLLVVHGKAQCRQYNLDLPAVIGRSRTTDMRLGHPLVSRRHCEVFEAEGTLMVRDLGSLNGTYVGDMRISEQATAVQPGDLLTVGPVTFQIVYGAPEKPPAAGELGGPTLDAPLADDSSAPNQPEEPPPEET